MKSFLFAVILVFPLARALGQTDSLSECNKKYLEWKKDQECMKEHTAPLGPLPLSYDPAAIYPDSARKAGIEGSVWVWCIVDTNGVPQCVRVVKGIGYGCDEAAVEAFKKWRFTPVVMGGRKCEAPTVMPFKFKLAMKQEGRETSDENH